MRLTLQFRTVKSNSAAHATIMTMGQSRDHDNISMDALNVLHIFMTSFFVGETVIVHKLPGANAS